MAPKVKFPFNICTGNFRKSYKTSGNFAKLQKGKCENFNEFLSRLFDVTFKSGTWLCTVDKQFYEIELKSGKLNMQKEI